MIRSIWHSKPILNNKSCATNCKFSTNNVKERHLEFQNARKSTKSKAWSWSLSLVVAKHVPEGSSLWISASHRLGSHAELSVGLTLWKASLQGSQGRSLHFQAFCQAESMRQLGCRILQLWIALRTWARLPGRIARSQSVLFRTAAENYGPVVQDGAVFVVSDAWMVSVVWNV